MKNVDQYNGLFFDGSNFSKVVDAIAIEEALKIEVNNISFTITMRTPGNEDDLVRGILYSENVIRSLTELPPIEVTEKNPAGFITKVNVNAPENLILKDFAGTRNVISSSSCGICGNTALDDKILDIKLVNNEVLNPALVETMYKQVGEKQKSFNQSGGTHAAGAFDINGNMLCMHEDIGRHNAVDKVIGFLINNKLLDKAKCLTVSGRVSYEIVSKCLSAGIPYLASVSAPSSLAIQYAENGGITLMAFCRNKNLTVYSNPGKILINQPELATEHLNPKTNV